MYSGKLLIAFGVGVCIGMFFLIRAFFSGKLRLTSAERDFFTSYQDLLGRLLLTERKFEIIEQHLSKYFLSIHSNNHYERAVDLYNIIQKTTLKIEELLANNRKDHAEQIIRVLLGSQRRASTALCNEVGLHVNDLKNWNKDIDFYLENVCITLEKTAASFEQIRKQDDMAENTPSTKRRKTFTSIAELKSLLEASH